MADDVLSSATLASFISSLADSGDDYEPSKSYQAEVVRFDQNGMAWCKIKDSDVLETPVEIMTAMVKEGDVIDVTIENGIVTGRPSSTSQVVTMDYANALVAALAGDMSLLEPYSRNGLFDDITAERASFNVMDVNMATMQNAEIENAKINNAIIESLQATQGRFSNLQANDLAVKRFSAERITASQAYIKSLLADKAYIDQLEARNATILDLLADRASIGRLIAGEATIQDLIAGNISADFVRADRANIDQAWIRELMAESAWFTQDVAVTGDQMITGQLKSVLIDGDTARFRNIYADALKILGEDGLYHRLNFLNYDDKTYNYVLAETTGSENPSELGWYELVDEEYVLSDDTEIENEIVRNPYEIPALVDDHIVTIDREIDQGDVIMLYLDQNRSWMETDTYSFTVNGEESEIQASYAYDVDGEERTSQLTVRFDGVNSFHFIGTSSSNIEPVEIAYSKIKDYYIRTTLSDPDTQNLVTMYGDQLDNALHGSHIIAETITATQLDASSVRAALLEAAEIQVGATMTPHIRMYEGVLGFYPGSTIVYKKILLYVPIEPEGNENPKDEGWYELAPTQELITEYNPDKHRGEGNIQDNELFVQDSEDARHFSLTRTVVEGTEMTFMLYAYDDYDGTHDGVSCVGGTPLSEVRYPLYLLSENTQVDVVFEYDGERDFYIYMVDQDDNVFQSESAECYIDQVDFYAVIDVQEPYIETNDTTVNPNKSYYSVDDFVKHASPRSRKWYELDPEIGYFRSTDAERDPDKDYYDGTEASVAYVTNQELYIPRAVVTDKMAIGTPDLGQWLWEVGDNQNLSLTWGGKYGGGS